MFFRIGCSPETTFYYFCTRQDTFPKEHQNKTDSKHKNLHNNEKKDVCCPGSIFLGLEYLGRRNS